MNDRKGIALIRIGDRQLCMECATEEQKQEIDGPEDVITDHQMECRACLVFCDGCGKVVNN